MVDTAETAEMMKRLGTGFDATIGLEYTELSPDRVRAQWTVKPTLHQPAGIQHGGVYCSVVESLASVGGTVWLGERGHVVGSQQQHRLPARNGRALSPLKPPRFIADAPSNSGKFASPTRTTDSFPRDRFASRTSPRWRRSETDHAAVDRMTEGGCGVELHSRPPPVTQVLISRRPSAACRQPSWLRHSKRCRTPSLPCSSSPIRPIAFRAKTCCSVDAI